MIELAKLDIRDEVSPRLLGHFGQYLGGPGARRLNLGCAKNHEKGFLNLDVSPNVGADVVFDLESPAKSGDLFGALPFNTEEFHCVLGSHVFEHIVGFIPLVRELYRILKPGGHLISVTPYCSSDDAIDNPFHVRAFSEMTWHYFNEALYATPGTAGYGDFGIDFTLDVVQTVLVPYPNLPHWIVGPDNTLLEEKRRYLRNVIQEIHVVLQKPVTTGASR